MSQGLREQRGLAVATTSIAEGQASSRLSGGRVLSDWARSISPSITVPSGTVVFLQDEASSAVFFIEEGVVLLSRQESNGASVMLHASGAGAVLGLAATATGLPQAMTATTQTTATLRPIPAASIRDALARDPVMAAAILEQLAIESSQLSQRCGELGCLSARERLARVLIEHASGDTPPIRVRVATVDVAMLVGADSSHVWRLLRAFRREGLVDTIKGRIVVLDLASLRLAARVVPPRP